MRGLNGAQCIDVFKQILSDLEFSGCIMQKHDARDSEQSPDQDTAGGLLAHSGLTFVIVAIFFAASQIARLRKAPISEDYDSLVRMASVREFMAEKQWYDTVFSRVLPPEGLDLHWSRPLDALLAGFKYLASLFVGPVQSEILVMQFWPAFLFAVFIVIQGAIVRSRFGRKAANLSMLIAVVSLLPFEFYFLPGQVDHHNLQLVLMALISWAAISGAGKRKTGLLVGALMALSLSIGLETVGFIGVAGGFMLLRFILHGGWEADRVGGAGLGVLAVAPMLFVLQTPVSDWGLARCDVLGGPVLGTVAVVGLCCFILSFTTRHQSRRGRVIWSIVLITMGVIILMPVLSPCHGGPYNMVPPDIQSRVIGSVLENQPLSFFLQKETVQGLIMALPFLGALVLMFPTLARGPERDARLFLFLIVALGLLAGAFQARMMIWGYAVLPAALGVVFWDFSRTSKVGLVWGLRLVLVLSAIFPHILGVLIARPWQHDTAAANVTTKEVTRCASQRALEPLNDLPPSVIFNPIETAGALLFYTRHSVTGASYHRSPRALELGVLPFLAQDDRPLREAVKETGAKYILLCRDQTYGGDTTIGTRLAGGETVGWLQELTLAENRALRIFAVRPEAFDK